MLELYKQTKQWWGRWQSFGNALDYEFFIVDFCVMHFSCLLYAMHKCCRFSREIKFIFRMCVRHKWHACMNVCGKNINIYLIFMIIHMLNAEWSIKRKIWSLSWIRKKRIINLNISSDWMDNSNERTRRRKTWQEHLCRKFFALFYTEAYWWLIAIRCFGRNLLLYSVFFLTFLSVHLHFC